MHVPKDSKSASESSFPIDHYAKNSHLPSDVLPPHHVTPKPLLAKRVHLSLSSRLPKHQQTVHHHHFTFKRKRTRSKLYQRIKSTFLTLATIVLVFLTTGLSVFAWFAKDLPSPDVIEKRYPPESTKIFDRTGTTLLYEIHGEFRRTPIPFSEMPESIKKATLAAEDDSFYKHRGVDFKGIARALLSNFSASETREGGSTITQQLAKNSFLSPERTIKRKVRELILAVEIESRFSKDQILERYLNEIPYGSNAYGIESASTIFLNKSARDLTLSEAAYLASLPVAPSYYSPYGANTDDLKARHLWVLDRMEKLGYVTHDEVLAAKEQAIAVIPVHQKIIAPHFVMYVKDQLVAKYGEERVNFGGLKVITTIDLDKQAQGEKAINDHIGRIQRWGGSNAALVAIDPRTGEILTMVGSRDYFDASRDGNVNVATRLRQPGSSFKPYVYAASWEQGYTPRTLIGDRVYSFPGGYKPLNYDRSTRGSVQMQAALAMSLNIPAVKAGFMIGTDKVAAFAYKLGLSQYTPENVYGESISIGAYETTLLEHVSGMGTFAFQGRHMPSTPIIKITDATGAVLEQLDTSVLPAPIVDPNIANNMANVMSNDALRAPVFGRRSPVTLPDRPVGAKTGTTEDFRDAWTVGYIPQLVAGVWVGNNDARLMYRGADGIFVAAPVWNQFMRSVTWNIPVENFAPASALTQTAAVPPRLR